MKKEELAEKLLSVFGYTAEELNCADAKTALGEVFENDANENIVSLLEIFVLRITPEQLEDLKNIVFD